MSSRAGAREECAARTRKSEISRREICQVSMTCQHEIRFSREKSCYYPGNVNEQRRPTGARLGHRRARRTRAMNPRNDRRDKPRDKDDPRRNDRHDRSGRGCVDGTNRTRFLVRRARFFFFSRVESRRSRTAHRIRSTLATRAHLAAAP